LTACDALRFVFFDCDDCCYQNQWSTADKITKAISAYVANLGVDKARAYALYVEHGTCLKGLLVEGLIDANGVEDFLHNVHLINYDDILPDARLRAIVERVAKRRFVFTASTKEHATRCLERVGIADLFEGIVDTRTCGLETKHSEASFRAAMRFAGANDARACVLIDDSMKNIKCAKSLGWRTVLVGLHDRITGELVHCPFADHHIASLHDLPLVCPELFKTLFETAPVQQHDVLLNRMANMGGL